MQTESKIYPKVPQRMSKWPPIILALIFFLVYGWNGITVQHWSSAPVRFLTAIIPLPAATVNGAVITYHDLLKREDILFWLEGDGANRQALLTPALDALIRQEAMEQIADQINVSVSKDELATARTKMIGEMSDDDFKKKIKAELNMSEAVFTQTVLRPVALAQALEAAVGSSVDLQEDQRSIIDQAVGELRAAASFSDVAQKYSDDPSADGGGDLGYLTAATMPQGWEALLSTAEGQTTGVMETDHAFVIAKVAWLTGEGDDVQIRTQAIVVNKKTLSEVLDDFLAKSVVDRIVNE